MDHESAELVPPSAWRYTHISDTCLPSIMKNSAVVLTTALLLLVASSLSLESAFALRPTLTFGTPQNLAACCFEFPQIAVSGANVYVVWIQGSDIMAKASNDYGATYNPAITIASSPDGRLVFPEILASGSEVHVTWIRIISSNQMIFYRRSLDNGLSWGQLTALSPPGQDAETDYQMSVSGNNIYVVWPEFSRQNLTSAIMFRRSLDGGTSFEPTTTLANPTSIGLFTMARLGTSSNIIHVLYPLTTYYNQSTNSFESRILYQRSFDNGTTFETARTLTLAPGWVGDVKLAISERRVFIVELDSIGVFLKTSTDAGATWDNSLSIAVPGSGVFPSDPQIALSGNNTYIAWETGGCADIIEQGTQCQIFFQRSTSGGMAWTKPVILSDTGAEMLLAASNNNVYLAWVEQQANMNIQILFRASMDKGATFENKMALGGPGLNQLESIGTSKNNVYVVWTAATSPAGAQLYVRHGTNT